MTTGTRVMRALAVAGLATAIVASSAHAVPARCQKAWWWESSSYFEDPLLQVPPDATVLLPLIWSLEGAPPVAGDAPRLDASAVTVEVRGPDEQLVDGTIGVGVDGSIVSFEPLQAGRLWWRPTAPLAVDSYLMHVRVQRPEAAGPCLYGPMGFLTQLSVGDAPSAPPSIGLELVLSLTDGTALAYAANCSAHARWAECPAESGPHGVCCYPGSQALDRTTRITLGDLPYGTGRQHYGVRVESDGVSATAPKRSVLLHLADDGTTTLEEHHAVAPDDGLPPALCTRATLVSLIDGRELATAERCIDTDDVLTPSDVPLVCEAATCQAIASSGDPGAEVDEGADSGCASSDAGTRTSAQTGLLTSLAMLIAAGFARRRGRVARGR